MKITGKNLWAAAALLLIFAATGRIIWSVCGGNRPATPQHSANQPPSPSPLAENPTAPAPNAALSPLDDALANQTFGPASQPAATPPAVITPDIQAAIDAGLKALAAIQLPDGGYRLSNANLQGAESAGITALAGMAFLAHGDLPTRGTYSEILRRIVDFIQPDKTGLLAHGVEPGGMYAHALSIEFLANLSLLSNDPAASARCRKILQRAVALTASAQNDDGGWRYTPHPADADCCQTASQLIALRAANDAGIPIHRNIPRMALRYLLDLQNPDGGFAYTNNTLGSEYARSAAALAALYHSGLHSVTPLTDAQKYLQPFFPRDLATPPQKIGRQFPYYGIYYAAQAMYLAGGDSWKNWYRANCADLVRKQATGGLWPDPRGDILATASSLVVLQFPRKGLPALTHEPSPSQPQPSKADSSTQR